MVDELGPSLAPPILQWLGPSFLRCNLRTRCVSWARAPQSQRSRHLPSSVHPEAGLPVLSRVCALGNRHHHLLKGLRRLPRDSELQPNGTQAPTPASRPASLPLGTRSPSSSRPSRLPPACTAWPVALLLGLGAPPVLQDPDEAPSPREAP